MIAAAVLTDAATVLRVRRALGIAVPPTRALEAPVAAARTADRTPALTAGAAAARANRWLSAELSRTAATTAPPPTRDERRLLSILAGAADEHGRVVASRAVLAALLGIPARDVSSVDWRLHARGSCRWHRVSEPGSPRVQEYALTAWPRPDADALSTAPPPALSTASTTPVHPGREGQRR